MPDSLNFTLKKQATAEEIQADLQGRIDRMSARDSKFAGCSISLPRPIRQRDEHSPNWTVDGFPGLQPGCFTAMVRILDQVRLEYELVA